MSYEEALAYMSSLLTFGIKLGLERFAKLLSLLGDPHKQFKSIHVAGTNGKGSTTAMIASILEAAGYKVGGYYSPYVFDVRERILIDGQMISKDDFAYWVSTIKPFIEQLAITDGMTTEFELKTAIAFCYFADKKVDFAAVEVGMGGRLDATNVLTPEVSVITNIGLDHTEYLGDTYEKIAYEKAGIIKPGVPIITAVDHRGALSTILKIADDIEAPIIYAIDYKNEGENIIINATMDRTVLLHPNLPGSYQAANAACAVEAVRMLPIDISDEAIRKGIASAWLPGRFQKIASNPDIYIDGAHNGEAAHALAEAWKQRKFNYLNVYIIIGMVNNHDPIPVLTALSSIEYSHFIFAEPPNPRALPANKLADTAKELGISGEVISDVNAAIKHAKAADAILITGSFFTIGAVEIKNY